MNQALSVKATEAFLQLMYDEKRRMRRLSRVGLWSIQSVIRNIIAAFESDHDFALIN